MPVFSCDQIFAKRFVRILEDARPFRSGFQAPAPPAVALKCSYRSDSVTQDWPVALRVRAAQAKTRFLGGPDLVGRRDRALARLRKYDFLGVKPRGTRRGIRDREKGAVRLPRILVLTHLRRAGSVADGPVDQQHVQGRDVGGRGGGGQRVVVAAGT